MSITDIMVIFAQCFWGVCEYIIFNKMKANDKNADKKSYKFLYIISMSSLVLGISIGWLLKVNNLFDLYNSSILFPIIGTIIIIFGLIIRLSAINQLKKYFTVNVTIRDDHKLITDGLYKYVRHPAYSGGILSFIGCGLCYGNILTFFIISTPYFILILNRIKKEEIILSDHFGNKYIELKGRTKKLIPFIF